MHIEYGVYIYIFHTQWAPLTYTPRNDSQTNTKFLIIRPQVKMLIYTRRSPKVSATPPTQISTVSSAM